jgi:hypothetical protein
MKHRDRLKKLEAHIIPRKNNRVHVEMFDGDPNEEERARLFKKAHREHPEARIIYLMPNIDMASLKGATK